MADDRYKLGSFYRTNQGSFIRSPMGARGAPIPLEVWRGPFIDQWVTGDTGLLLNPGVYPPIFPDDYFMGKSGYTFGQQFLRQGFYESPTGLRRYKVTHQTSYIDVPDRPITHAVLSIGFIISIAEESLWHIIVYKSINCVNYDINDFNFIELGQMGSSSAMKADYSNTIERNGYFEEGTNIPVHIWGGCHEIQIPLIASMITPGERLFIALVSDAEYIYHTKPTVHSGGHFITASTFYLLLDGDQKFYT